MSTPYRTTQLGACAGCGQYRQGWPCTTCQAPEGERVKRGHFRRAQRHAYRSRLVRIKIASDRALVEDL